MIALVAWLSWAILCAGALRLALAWLAKRYLRLDLTRAAIVAYATMAVIFFSSVYLHKLVLGDQAMYGATPRQSFSLLAYFIAPFGLPLLVGSWFVVLADCVRGIVSFSRGARLS